MGIHVGYERGGDKQANLKAATGTIRYKTTKCGVKMEEVEGSVGGGGCLFLAVGQLEISTTHGERPLCHCY